MNLPVKLMEYNTSAYDKLTEHMTEVTTDAGAHPDFLNETGLEAITAGDLMRVFANNNIKMNLKWKNVNKTID